MAKNHKWEGTVLHYTIPGAGEGGAAAEATIDVGALPDAVKQAALLFGVQTAARNATAGLFSEDPVTAFKRMTARFKNWLDGQWKAASAGEDSILTEREIEVLSLLARGYLYAEIGKRLGISLNTVTSHIKNSYRKLAVHSGPAAVTRAAALGLLRQGEDKVPEC